MTQAMEATERLAGTQGERAPAVRASERLWNLGWPSWQFGETTVAPGTFAEALPFISEHFAKIFPSEPGRFLHEAMTPAKRRFLDESDVMLFRDQGRIIGLWVGNPLDWSTYYMRMVAVLPQCRRRGIMNDFLSAAEPVLRAVGVQRLEGDCAPTNIQMNRALLRQGWVVTSTINSDRWGTVLRYTKFLTPEAESCFQRQFIANPPAASGQEPVS